MPVSYWGILGPHEQQLSSVTFRWWSRDIVDAKHEILVMRLNIVGFMQGVASAKTGCRQCRARRRLPKRGLRVRKRVLIYPVALPSTFSQTEGTLL